MIFNKINVFVTMNSFMGVRCCVELWHLIDNRVLQLLATKSGSSDWVSDNCTLNETVLSILLTSLTEC